MDNQSSINGRGSESIFSLPHCTQTGSGAHPASYTTGTGGILPEVRRPGREDDHLSPSSVEVKISWSYFSFRLQVFLMLSLIKQIHLHGVVLTSLRTGTTVPLLYKTTGDVIRSRDSSVV
jgi:hypothetical protein